MSGNSKVHDPRRVQLPQRATKRLYDDSVSKVTT